MSAAFLTLTILTMAAVLGVLMIGVFSLARGGEFSRKYGNKLMRLRVMLQGCALLFFILAMLAFKK